ncbi:hypothetical protein AUP68_15252 [Ilyonectria robusta]
MPIQPATVPHPPLESLQPQDAQPVALRTANDPRWNTTQHPLLPGASQISQKTVRPSSADHQCRRGTVHSPGTAHRPDIFFICFTTPPNFLSIPTDKTETSYMRQSTTPSSS